MEHLRLYDGDPQEAGRKHADVEGNQQQLNLPTQRLLSIGTYTVVIDPSGSSVGIINVRVTDP